MNIGNTMDDDIDDLLDEVETKYCDSTKSKQTTKPSKPPNRGKLGDEIDELLHDIDTEKMKAPTKLQSEAPRPQARPDQAKKCFPVFIGSSAHAHGLGNNVNKKTCDKLRCTKCDFKVCQFDGFEWAPDVDYLFLRNNVPDFSKLKERLVPSKGARAYCCQCSSRSITSLMELNDANLKWVCGRH